MLGLPTVHIQLPHMQAYDLKIYNLSVQCARAQCDSKVIERVLWLVDIQYIQLEDDLPYACCS